MAEPAHRNPFPGLRPFRPDEEHLFFGREHQVDRMVDKLAKQRFLAVVGTSGSGKSSLVNCGLRPALHRGYMAGAGAAWRIAQLRPGSQPIAALAQALAAPGVLFDADAAPAAEGLSLAQLVEGTLRLGSLGLVDLVEQARLAPGENLLVVADQFEELFRFHALMQPAGGAAYGPSEDAIAFVRLLLEAAAQRALPIYVVLTMRSDFLGECAQFHGLPEAINEGQYLVPRLTRDEIRAAIAGPVHVARAQISPLLLTRLLNDVGDNPDQLSILQHALNRTWARWEGTGGGQGAIELTHYEAIGAMASALDQHAEKAFGELTGPRQQRICERLFKALTDKGTDPRGIRRPTRLAALGAMCEVDTAEVAAVIEHFRKPSRSFLMPPVGEALTPETVIDISHESLMRVWRRLVRWADEEALSALAYRRLVETAALHDAGQASPWRDPDLRRALDWRRVNEPNAAWAAMYPGDFAAAMRFLDHSRELQVAEKLDAEIERRWRSGWNLLPVVLVAAAYFVAQSIEPLRELVSSVMIGVLSVQDWTDRWESWRQVEQLALQLLTGVPAVLGYVALAPYAKKLFRDLLLKSYARREGAARALVERLEQAAEAPAVDAAERHATSPAGFWRRLFAHLLDWLVLALPLCVLSVAIIVGFEGEDKEPAPVLAVLGPWVIAFWLYRALLLSRRGQATLGMKAAGIFLTDLRGEPVSFARASGRHLMSAVSYYAAGLGFLMQPFNRRRQTLHDRVAGTVVLRRRPPAPAP
ncbi:MAG: RDD family protein [Piscinibacter sp.]|nr:RDD family protein [Piscinibacter sp.]